MDKLKYIRVQQQNGTYGAQIPIGVDAINIDGIIPIQNIPKAALERLTVVQNDAARFALTTATVQTGDTVKVTDTGQMYYIIDDTKLNIEAGYVQYSAGTAASVPWAGVTDKPTTVSGYGITDAFTESETQTLISNHTAKKAASPTTTAYLKGEYVFYDNKTYLVTQDIASGTTLTVGTNIKEVKLADEITEMKRGNTIKDFVNSSVKVPVGTLLTSPWTDTTNGKIYDNPWRVNHYETVELEGGQKIYGAWLENVYVTSYGVQFSHQRAFLRCPEGLAAGSYYFTFNENVGTYVVKDDVVGFTITNNVPIGGRIAGCYASLNTAKTNWRIYVYDADGKTILETITPVFEIPSGATDLGRMKANSRTGNLNSIYEMSYGCNRWAISAMKQWLNSEAGVGEWWTAQDDWDIAPGQLATKPGYLTGLSQDFKALIGTAKTTTYKNTATYDGSADITYDKVRLISLEQMYLNKQIAGEGQAHEYWKNLNGTDTPWPWYTAYEILKHYTVENHTSTQSCRLRSASRGYSYATWFAGSSGEVASNVASTAYRCAPLVFIPLVNYGIRTTLDSVTSNFATVENTSASQNHSVDDFLVLNDNLYKVTSTIAAGEKIIPGTNATKVSLGDELSLVATEQTGQLLLEQEELNAALTYVALDALDCTFKKLPSNETAKDLVSELVAENALLDELYRLYSESLNE